ncbi:MULTISPECIES: response regulator transcription factor [unclassified Streptomyces]|uniref:response regulator transcription factor n=1 Tax=unclassified Streptomyces TaxID=2593676 RepID=UPI00088333E9|nr:MULTISPECIES: response regulator transcription factor [unclassified Streptomyces]PBC81182.1 DNA-binding NarL/FixJ family response regulator [Streptomyces sp. 2321.6]SDR56092.1 DNA-binding response regulator, NarL/FixJ family, contains REC and HTH domains [Streptomyces sp. KS_16]SEC04607.1 DNA-binding response regulator, NarL/FixJ family, contains REC and HTH domains [Streptomyces sp. 2133.1]SNC64130.1 DNA-binding response regulator, NarL/FixJ family, contains REC and HTH domains [Streptomyce
MLDTRVTVTVHTSDPLGRAGVVSHLQQQPSVEIVQDQGGTAARERVDTTGRQQEGGGEAAGTVAISLIDRFDDMAAAELRRLARGGEQRVVLIAGNLREPDLMTIVEYGVRAIIWRHQATPQRLVQAVQSAARGEGDLPPDLISKLLTQVGQLRRSAVTSAAVAWAPTVGMAPREVDVLRLVADGLDTRQISEKLAYSERTVKNVLHALMTRLQLHNRAHAVAYALREGYI